jgi:dihydroflavonol-4-reductase
MKTVGIIGGSGFIGSHTTKKFLEEGFRVKVSSTDINNKNKYKHLLALKNAENLEILSMDVRDVKTIKSFVSGCDIVVHCGTPFILDIQDPQTQLFEPTVSGTENFLEVVKITPGIEKVVFVASVAGYNTNFPMPAGGKSFTDTFDENDTKFTSTESHPYGQAKFMANQTVEKFIADNPDASFEISSVSPVLVIGKSLSGREDSTSTGMQFLFKNRIAPDAFVQSLYDNDVPFAMVDVKDVAEAIHKTAITKNLNGKNYLLSSETYKVSDTCAMLNNKEPKEEGTIIYKNDLASRDLGIQFRPVREALGS